MRRIVFTVLALLCRAGGAEPVFCPVLLREFDTYQKGLFPYDRAPRKTFLEGKTYTIPPADLTKEERVRLRADNARVLDALGTPLANPAVAIDAAAAEKIFDALASHPVAGIEQLPWYTNSLWKDVLFPKLFGPLADLCFGRAVAAQLEAERQGVNPDAIIKLWVIGSLRDPKTGEAWQYHTATAVPAAGGGYWVLDPEMGKPLSVSEWYARMGKDYNESKDMRLFATRASRWDFLGGSNEDLARKSSFKKFFQDLAAYYRNPDPVAARTDLEVQRREYRERLRTARLALLGIGTAAAAAAGPSLYQSLFGDDDDEAKDKRKDGKPPVKKK